MSNSDQKTTLTPPMVGAAARDAHVGPNNAGRPAIIEPGPRAIAEGIYAQWRNTHLNNLSPDAFEKLQAAAPALIAEIAKHLR